MRVEGGRRSRALRCPLSLSLLYLQFRHLGGQGRRLHLGGLQVGLQAGLKGALVGEA